LQLRRPELPEAEKQGWRWQRSHGLSLKVLEQAEGEDLRRLWRGTASPACLKRVRRALRRAQPLEYAKTG